MSGSLTGDILMRAANYESFLLTTKFHTQWAVCLPWRDRRSVDLWATNRD